MASSTGGWKSRDELKFEKELDEARKAGTAAPLTDEYGRDISPHIPQYIAQAPWYISRGTPTLSHQRLNPEAETTTVKEWYTRGAKKEGVVTKFRKGACTNCGAMGHAAKLCLSRPRKVSAKFTEGQVVYDDVEAPNLQLGYDSSRDRWNGYDPNDYQRVFDRYKKVEEERRNIIREETNIETGTAALKKKEDKVKFDVPNVPAGVNKLLVDDDEDEGGDEDADVKLKGDEDQIGSKVDAKTRTTIRNLRIREDTAKYLVNLDINSAFYDPKTRSMRANPLPGKDPTQLEFAGENFIRGSGEAKEFDELQRYTMEATDKGQAIHMQAAPSQTELLHREFQTKKQYLQNIQKQKIMEKYGGEDHITSLPKALLLGQTETYVEYAPDGKLITGASTTIQSKWSEDQLIGNHTCVWGSFWQNGKWGFGCCHQFEKNSYCTGESGKIANLKSLQSLQNRMANYAERKAETTNSDKQRKNEEEDDSVLTGKRKYESFATTEVNEEQLEEYKKKRIRAEDPMADYFSQSQTTPV